MVEFTKENLEELLINQLRKNTNFEEIIDIVQKNSGGNIYLIGGAVSRTLATALYGGKQKNQDFDFVVDKLNNKLDIPDDWRVSHQKFNNPTFKKDDIEIDVFPLSDLQYIKINNMEPTIENFLAGVPFTIQALVFDVLNKELIGNVGIKALKTRTLKVHNAESAKEVAKRKGISVNDRMKQKAESMDFDIVPIDQNSGNS